MAMSNTQKTITLISIIFDFLPKQQMQTDSLLSAAKKQSKNIFQVSDNPMSAIGCQRKKGVGFP